MDNIVFENDILLIFPDLFLISITLLILLYGVIFATDNQKNYPILHKNTIWLVLYSLIILFFFLLSFPIKNGTLFYNLLLFDTFSYFIKILILITVFFSIVISFNYILDRSINIFEYIILILLSTCSMFFLVTSADFISMYLTIELQSLSFYVLAAIKRNSEFSTEAGLKYFLLGAFSSGLLLFGCSMIYGFTGTTHFSDLNKIFTCGTTVFSNNLSFHVYDLGMVFLIVGFFFKLTVVPFHMWAPDVYQGALTPVTAFFAITPKIALLAVFLKIVSESFYPLIMPWQKMILLSSLASMVVGAFAAMYQFELKRLLAYSSIGHMGYLLAGFCCGTLQGLQGIFLYLIIYVVMNISLFAVILLSIRRDNTHFSKGIQFISDLTMLTKSNSLLAITVVITLFSMAGIPPLAGFYSKAFLFFATMSSSLYLLALIGVLTSVLSCFYYIRIVKIIYFETNSSWSSFVNISNQNSLPLAFCFLFLLFFMKNITFLYLVTHNMAFLLSF